MYSNVPYYITSKGGYAMAITEMITAVSTIGFPIVMCLLMGKYITEVNNTHKEESKYFTEAINRNTEAITKLQMTLEHTLKEGD